MILQLVKGRHRYAIVYDDGGEALAIEAFVDWVKNPEVPFDWYDASVLSHQLGSVLGRDLSKRAEHKQA